MQRLRFFFIWLIMVWVAFFSIAPPAASATTVETKDNSNWVYLPQGWNSDERQRYYQIYEGSQLIPYDWFLALEQPDHRELLRSDENIERFRYLPGITDSRFNPNGLPVGFTKEQDPKTGTWIGFNCAACHTGQIDYKGNHLRIDGAPALADFTGFTQEMLASLKATVARQAKFDRFAKRVLGNSLDEQQTTSLQYQVRRFTEDFEGYIARNTPLHAYGYGRLDALGSILNEVSGTALKIPDNIKPPAAAVSYPSLWLTPQFEWVQWNGAVNNPLTRNVGQALSVFGKTTLSGSMSDRFSSTVYIRNLYELENQIDTLKPPVWPENILGKIDRERAGRGEAIFEANCASCHANKPPYPMTAPNRFGHSFIKVERTKIADLGTDSAAAAQFAKRTSKLGSLAAYFNSPDGRTATEAPTPVLLGFVSSMVAERQLDELRLLDEEKVMYRGYRERIPPGDLMVYRAVPLAGTWATAPYLHNGSVPNLMQLLLPAARRDKSFYVGSREFDPENVGFKTEPSQWSFEFRTDVEGNSNAGHEYGTLLEDEDRQDLLEYLKTL